MATARWWVPLLMCAFVPLALLCIRTAEVFPSGLPRSEEEAGAPDLRAGGSDGSLRVPSIVMGGIGDSGTRSVTRALHYLGLGHCPHLDVFVEPLWAPYFDRYRRICFFQTTGHLKMTRSAYMQHDPLEFSSAVTFFQQAAGIEWECMLRHAGGGRPDEKAWGYKEPHFAWLLPVFDEAYNNRSNYLIIARDPRDICTNRVQDQFKTYGKCMGIGNCYEWWATFWDELLAAYEAEARFAIVRIEDLVMPDPRQSNHSLETLRCVAEHAGMPPLFGPRWGTAMALLGDFHAHSATTYMGHHNGQTQSKRIELAQNLSQMTTPVLIHRTMRRLGYDPTEFGLLQPESKSVLCRHLDRRGLRA